MTGERVITIRYDPEKPTAARVAWLGDGDGGMTVTDFLEVISVLSSYCVAVMRSADQPTWPPTPVER